MRLPRAVLPRAAAAVALLVLLAGCAGSRDGAGDGEAAPSGGTGPHDGHEAAQHLLAPTWAIGHHWALTSPQGGSFTHVVSADAGGDWVLDTDSQSTAFFDAQSDISFLGKVRKSDLAGSQGDTRVEFLKFPLTQGLQWSTTWDGLVVGVTAERVSDGTADLVALRPDGKPHAAYTYSDKAGYFSRMAFYDDAGDAVAFEWSLDRAGTGFGGELVRWTLVELFSTEGAISTGHASSFQVAAGFTDIWMQAALDCTAGAVSIAVGPFTGPAEDRGYSAQGACPLVDAAGYPVSAPAQAEQWGALVTGVPAATTGTFDLTVYGRTLVAFAPGEAPS